MSENVEVFDFEVEEYIEPDGYYYANGDEVTDPDLEKGLRYCDILNGKLVWIYEPFTDEKIQQLQQERIKEQAVNELPQFIEDYDTVVCELYEQILAQQEIISDQDTAICELYELFMGA